MDLRCFVGSLALLVLVTGVAALEPLFYIEYCKPTCSPRTEIYKNVDKITYCYHPTKIPYGAYKYRRLAVRVARHYGIDPAVFCAQIECESAWNPRAVGPGGGYGLTQVTGRGEVKRLFDPLYNLRLGAQIKAQSYTLARRMLKGLGVKNPPERCVTILALRIYNGGTRFLRKELSYLVSQLNQSPCSWSCQKSVCARDKCLWKVNISYVEKVLNTARKYSNG